MFKYLKQLIDTINNWFSNALPKNMGIRPEDSFAFKDDAEKKEVYDEILDNRSFSAGKGLKWLILIYLFAILFLIFSHK